MYSIHLNKLTSLNIAICTVLYGVYSVAAVAEVNDVNNAINETVIDFGTATVYAQQTKPDDYVKLENDSANLLELTNQETPRAISTVTQAQMQDFEIYDMQEVIDTSNGVKVEAIEQGRWWIRSRGFEVDNVAVDGFGTSFNLDNVTGSIDVAAYDSMDVVRGANGMMSNSGNASATVNLIRKMPTAKTEGKIKATINENGFYRLDGDASGKLNESGSLRGRFVSAYGEGDTYMDRNEKQNGVIYGVLEGDINDNVTVAAGHEYVKQSGKGVMWGGLPLVNSALQKTDYDVSDSTAPSWSTVDNKINQTFIKADIDYANFNTQLKAERRKQKAETDWAWGTLPVALGMAASSPNELAYQASIYDTENSSNMFSAKTATDFNLFDKNHEVAVSAQYAKSDTITYFLGQTSNYSKVADITNWDGNLPKANLSFKGLPASVDIDRVEKSLAVSSRLNPIDNLHLLLGGRYTKYDYEGQAYGSSWNSSYDKFSPSVGATYDIDAIDTTLYGSYSDIFKYQSQADINGKTFEPKKGNSKEVGVKKSFNNGNALVSLAYFQNTIENPAVVAGQRSDGSFYHKIGGERQSQGVEIDLSGKLTDSITINAGYANTDVDVKSGKPITAYPEHMVKMSANYNPAMLPKLRVGSNLNWQSKTYATDKPAQLQGVTLEAEQPAYATIDLFGEYAITDNVLLKLNVDNVTNEKYYASLWGAEKYGGAFFNTIFGKPRTTTVSVVMKY